MKEFITRLKRMKQGFFTTDSSVEECIKNRFDSAHRQVAIVLVNTVVEHIIRELEEHVRNTR